MQATNFAFLEGHDSLLLQLATTAESAFVPDPNTNLLKLRQLGEALAHRECTIWPLKSQLGRYLPMDA
jgi:hypothetical protein